jgi:hypothetical protein
VKIVGTRRERIDSLASVAQACGDSVNRSFASRHEDVGRYGTRKRIRAGIEADIERYRFAKRSVEILREHDNLEEGFKAMHEFQHAFEWKADKRWRRYFA